MNKQYLLHIVIILLIAACSKSSTSNSSPNNPPATNFAVKQIYINGLTYAGSVMTNVTFQPKIEINFDAPITVASVNGAVTFTDAGAVNTSFTTTLTKGDSTLVIQPTATLFALTTYTVTISKQLQSKQGGFLQSPQNISFTTGYDLSDKFPRISDTALLTLVQRQTFKYFWDFAHPTSGMARERNASGDVVTTGGTGFGIMATLVAVNRGFVTRTDALNRITKITQFLTQKATTYHGAFAHWINGSTGATVPFSTNDNGADLVETSFLMQGLLTARQFFNQPIAEEQALVSTINTMWQSVEWSWFTQNNQQQLYWHWSADKGWVMNLPIKGWNEALITHVLAAISPTFSVPSAVYTNGWAQNGNIKNGNSYYGYTLPLGPSFGGPMFLAHYSFLGIDPNGLSDTYANYLTQNTQHSLINWTHCKQNPGGFPLYSDSCWGLTACDIPSGYAANSPSSDIGVVAPTAALASMPYTPQQSMAALRFFYYQLGNKLWGDYGFYDAFSLKQNWFSNTYLAIDQGPIIVMIENYRSGLLWKLFMSCPEVKSGMKKMGFQSPYF